MKNAIAPAALAAALALSGCGLLEAEAKSKALCVEQANVRDVPAYGAPGVPVVPIPLTPMFETRINLSAAVTDPTDAGVELDMFPDSFSLGSSTRAVNMNGVETAVLTVLPPAGRPDLQPVVFRYQRPTPAPAEVFVIVARPEGRVDVADYLEANDELRVGVQFSGVPPQQAWTATLELCGETRVSVNYWDAATN